MCVMLFLFMMYYCVCVYVWFFFFKQKTAYEMRISDWSSDVCSSDLLRFPGDGAPRAGGGYQLLGLRLEQIEIGRDPVGDAANTASGIVTDIDYIGDMTTIEVRLGDGRLVRASQLNALPERSEEHTSELQ